MTGDGHGHCAGAATAAGGGGNTAATDGHENDLLMPGFRFHPTEEELIEFYLRRKVEGKRFNVELIAFVDLYRYDPWQLPAISVIGEKEWFFYVPRDRKYRNGDRPNRVTASGYWKATGADRMIHGENHRPIGLKKTLVFYSGKAPKGIRSGWIMNEYRLPPADGDPHHKSEISLCRVYKRSGIDDGHRQTSSARRASSCGSASSRHGSSSSSTPRPPTPRKFHQFQGECSSSPAIMDPPSAHNLLPPPLPSRPCAYTSALSSTAASAGNTRALASTYSLLNTAAADTPMDELSTLVAGHGRAYINHTAAAGSQFLPLPSPHPTQMTPLGVLPAASLAAIYSDKLWDWNPDPDTTAKDCSNISFK